VTTKAISLTAVFVKLGQHFITGGEKKTYKHAHGLSFLKNNYYGEKQELF
jgi:hypothetical protein